MWPSVLPLDDILGMILYCCIDGLGLVGNLLLLAAIVLRSPTSLRSYSVILLNSATIDLVACICSISVMMRAVPTGWALVYVYLGPCSMTTPFVCHLAYTMLLHTFVHSLYLIIVSFVYRLHVLKGDHSSSPSRIRVFVICLLVYIPSFSLMVVYLFALDPQDKVLDAIVHQKPDFEWEAGYMFAGHASVLKPVPVLTIICMVGPALPAMIVISMLRSRVIRILNENARSMSKRTHEQHTNLIKVLSFQAILPIFFFGGGFSYIICQIGLVCSLVQQHLTIAIWGLMPAAAPFVTLYYVRPYKLFVLSLAGGKMNAVATNGSITAVSSVVKPVKTRNSLN